MFDYREVLQSLARRMSAENAVYVRETNFGYVIRSEKMADGGGSSDVASKFSLGALTFAALAIWIAPGWDASVTMTGFMSFIFLTMGAVAYFMIKRTSAGIELHVDLTRSELRAATVTAKGEAWIRSCAGFDEVEGVQLRKVKSDPTIRSLCLRIVDEDDMMPVAVGDERMLLTVHDRLVHDLNVSTGPRVAQGVPTRSAQVQRRQIFPQLGPDEQSL